MARPNPEAINSMKPGDLAALASQNVPGAQMLIPADPNVAPKIVVYPSSVTIDRNVPFAGPNFDRQNRPDPKMGFPQAVRNSYHEFSDNAPGLRKAAILTVMGGVAVLGARHSVGMFDFVGAHSVGDWAGGMIRQVEDSDFMRNWGGKIRLLGGAVVGASLLRDSRSIARSGIDMAKGVPNSAVAQAKATRMAVRHNVVSRAAVGTAKGIRNVATSNVSRAIVRNIKHAPRNVAGAPRAGHGRRRRTGP
jgi:hypothetical protein